MSCPLPCNFGLPCCPALPCNALPWRPCPALLCRLPCPALPSLVQVPAMPCPTVLPCIARSSNALQCPVLLQCPTLPYHGLGSTGLHALLYLALNFSALPCTALHCIALPYLALLFPALACLALLCRICSYPSPLCFELDRGWPVWEHA